MKRQSISTNEQIEKLIFDNKLDISIFRQKLSTYDKIHTQDNNHSIIFSLIDILIIEENFYDYFSSSSQVNYNHTQPIQINQKSILQYGYEIVGELFTSKSLFQNQQFVLNNTILKKCNLDIFLLISMTKGYLQNSTIKKQKIRTFFVQNFKKNNNHFSGIQRFAQFHQSLLEKSSITTSFIHNQNTSEKYRFQLSYFIDFYSLNKQFFPSILQCDNLLFKMMISIKLETEQDIRIYQKFQKQYFQQNQYHLVTTCKNIRFLIEFFRNPFNEKVISFYPQKVFLKMLAKYKRQEIDKILSYSEVGLTWNSQQISCCIGNIFKLGLTPITFTFFKSLLGIWLRNGFYDLIVKASEIYIPKIFIFMKHQKLFDVSFSFLQQFVLGPRNPTINVLNKLLEKLFTFYQKDCPLSKKLIFEQFMCLIESKYEKVATLEDKNYIQLKNLLKNINENQKRALLKQQQVKQKLNALEWQQTKVNLFGKSGSKGLGKSAQKQAGQFRGLQNIGNSCYMNSFLQCLYMTIEFRYNILTLSTLALEQNILHKMQQTETSSNESSKDKMGQKPLPPQNKSLMARQIIRPTAELQRLFAQLMKSNRPSINPITIKNVSSPQFKNSFQQDTIQFGRSLLDTISRSSVENIFEGQQTNQIICQNCSQSRYKKENFIDIMLTDYDDQEQTKESDSQAKSQNQGLKVGKMLKKCFQSQKMQGLTCDFCSTRSLQSLKKHYLSKLPNYLILTMKRFCYDIKENKNVKKHYRIDLDQGLIKVQGQMYELYGIIVHRGQSANSGHYFTFCKEWKFNQKINLDQQKTLEKQKIDFMEEENKIQQHQKQEQIESVQICPQKMQIQNQQQILAEKQPQSNLIKIDKQIPDKVDQNRWLCLNDSHVSAFQSFHNVKQFLDLNQQDTPYVLFYQKLSHTQSPEYQKLKQPIKLRQPLEKFLEKDNNQYLKFLDHKARGNLNSKQVDWKNFGKVKGFTAYDFFKFTKQDEDDNGNGFGGNGFGNNPIL